MPPLGPGMGALDGEDAVLDISGDDGQVLGSGGHMTHAAGHTLALENTARSGACAHRTGTALVLVRTVSTAVGLEAPTLDGTGEALTLGGAGHVDLSTLFEQVSGQFLAGLELIDVVGAHLDEVATPG